MHDFHLMDSSLFLALLMDLLRYTIVSTSSMSEHTVNLGMHTYVRDDQVWDHISGKLKKDLQYQADVSSPSVDVDFICLS